MEAQPEKTLKDTKKFEISSDEEEQPADFSYLLNSHASSSSHFILKSDQEKFQNTDSVISTSKYFNVDINLLNASIKSLPFNEVYSSDIIGTDVEWSSDELSRMKEVARINEEIYKSLLVNKYISENNQAIEGSNPIQQVSEKIEKLNVEPLKVVEKIKAQQSVAVDSNQKESMEQWLDDVLDL